MHEKTHSMYFGQKGQGFRKMVIKPKWKQSKSSREIKKWGDNTFELLKKKKKTMQKYSEKIQIQEQFIIL